MNESTREPTGSVAEEAAKLFAALQQRLGRPGADPSTSGEPSAATHTPECRACPVCQTLAAVRTVRPEVVEHLVAAAGSLTAALRVAFDGAEHRAPDRADPGSGAEEDPAGREQADTPRMERIEVL